MSDSFDEQISALYRKASQDAPPEHLDEAILALAKREAQSKSFPSKTVPLKTKAVSPFAGKWTLPFSLAAVIVLSVSLITLVEKESSRTTASKLEELTAPQETTAPPLVKDEALEKEAQPRGELADAEQRKKSRPEKKSANAPPPKLTRQKPLRISSANTQDKAAVGASAEKPASLPRAKQPAPAAIEADRAVSKQIFSEATQTASVKAKKRTTSGSEQKRPESAAGLIARQTPAQTERPAKREPQTISKQPLPSRLSSNKSLLKQTAPAAISAAAEPAVPAHCQSLTAKQCLQSPQCTYVLSYSDAQYQCRKAANRCEQDFIQLGSMDGNSGKALCEGKPGCRFIPGDCRCPKGEQCDCRGKNPPQCAP